MGKYEEYYEDLVIRVAHAHGHRDAPKKAFKIKKSLDLDFDKADELIEEADEELEFFIEKNGYVWLKQNRDLLEFIKRETDQNLEFIGVLFSHLQPPDLREEYDLPPPHF